MPVEGGDEMVLHCPGHAGHGPGESGAPLIAVVVENEADRGTATPKGRKEREAILYIDDEIGLPEPHGAQQGCTQILGVGATRWVDGIAVIGDRATSDESDIMTTLGQAGEKAIDQQLTAAGLRMVEVSPTHHHDAHRAQAFRRRGPGSRLNTRAATANPPSAWAV